jgi:hypothetical protein
MLAYLKKVPYEPPTLTVLGKVECLTAVFRRGPRDLLFRGNLL